MVILLLIIDTILSIVLSIIILQTISEINSKEVDTKKTKEKGIRKHLAIQNSKYENSFGGRYSYDKYKNTDGLYEPVKPSKGIELKKEA